MKFLLLMGAALLGQILSATAYEYLTYRLPQNVRPINYNITLMVEVEKNKFQGLVTIELQVVVATSSIVIHAADLKFIKASLRSSKTHEEIEVIDLERYGHLDFWVFILQKRVEAGMYSLVIEYKKGETLDLPDKAGVIQLENYDAEKTEIVATTNGVKARAILPCFDEPALKATFDVTISHEILDGYYALSNMDVEDVTEHDHMKITKFRKTPQMSTYNLGFVITSMPYRSTTVFQEGLEEPFELKIYAGESMLQNLDLYLKYAKETLKFVTQYTNISYPLPKLDLVVLANPTEVDPICGNWGLVVMKRNPSKPSSDFPEAQDVRRMMSMLAGIWFGGLVSPNWWEDVWLNTDLSAFMGWKAMTSVTPNLTEISNYRDKSLTSLTQLFYGDQYSFSEPIIESNIRVIRKNFIREGKGIALLMMAENVVGEGNFKKAISKYMKTHEYGTVTTSDLIEELQTYYRPIHLTNMMASFTRNGNFPMVRLEKLEDGSYKIKQSYKYVSLDYSKKYNLEQAWVIPLTIKTANKIDMIWVKKMEYIIPGLDADWATISFSGFVYGFTDYSDNLWLAIATALQEDVEVLHYLERVNILMSVQYHLPNLNYSIAFEIFKFLENETNTFVWDIALDILDGVRTQLQGTAVTGFKRFGQQLIKNYFQTSNWTKDILESDHYGKVFDFACRCELEECLTFAETLFEGIDLRFFLTNREIVIATSSMKKITNGDVWLKYWNDFDKSPSKDLFLMLMTSKDIEFLKRVLQRTASAGVIYIIESWLPAVAPIDPDLVLSLLREEMSKNEQTREYLIYEAILRYSVDPEITLAVLGSPEMKEFYKHAHSYFMTSYIARAQQSVTRIEPIKKWLKDNGYMNSHSE